jgi:hypothetical protein
MNIDLQNFDCNCNDCFFMKRDIDKYKESLKRHEKWQKDYFENNKLKNPENKKQFIFDKSTCIIHYGFCEKLKKDVSFIPNIFQYETQKCFEHRRLNKII